jgi:hypothetical protein
MVSIARKGHPVKPLAHRWISRYGAPVTHRDQRDTARGSEIG